LRDDTATASAAVTRSAAPFCSPASSGGTPASRYVSESDWP